MTRNFALVALVFICASLSASPSTNSLDTFIEAELPSSAAPGLAYARVDNGNAVGKGFGESRKGGGGDISADTLFPIGSVTKSFTALAIMQLVEADKLGLDDPVSMHLPAFSRSPAREVTLRQLLNHTSGFSTVLGNSHHGDADLSQVNLVEYAGRLAQVGPVHPPGTHWEYSNANYQILGAVIEQVSGHSYADHIRSRIFEPLEMTSSEVVAGSPPPDMANGHSPWFGGVRITTSGDGHRINAPAGGIASTARDMGRYLAFWLGDGDEIVSADLKAAMLTPSSPASPSYGLGWSIDPDQGSVYHTGLMPGYETLASFNVAQRKGAVVMVNANGGLGFADTWDLIGGAAARAMGGPHEASEMRLGPKIAYLSIALLPPLFLALSLLSWKGRARLCDKRASKAGQFSLWFPFFAMGGLAWFLIDVLPRLFGGSLATLRLYQPDFALCLTAAAILAPAWAAFRLIAAYSAAHRPIDHAPQ